MIEILFGNSSKKIGYVVCQDMRHLPEGDMTILIVCLLITFVNYNCSWQHGSTCGSIHCYTEKLFFSDVVEVLCVWIYVCMN